MNSGVGDGYSYFDFLKKQSNKQFVPYLAFKTFVTRKNSIIIRFVSVEFVRRASHSQVSPAEGCAETETYYPGRDYTPRASQLNIIHLKASAFAVSLHCHP